MKYTSNQAQGLVGIDIKGAQYGVTFKEGCGPGPCVQVLSEDDGIWHETDVRFSPAWLDDIIEVLQKAKKLYEDAPKQEVEVFYP